MVNVCPAVRQSTARRRATPDRSRTGGAGGNPCTYSLSRDRPGRDMVYVWLTAESAWPPSGTREFSLDGTPAAWRDNTLGGGYLYVDRPTGRFEVTVVFDASYRFSREAAIQIWRAAAPHVP